MLGAVAGWEDLHLNDRASGGWIGVAVIALWTGRRHIAEVVRIAVGRQAEPTAGDEPLRYRTLGVLTVASGAAVVAMCVLVGMSPWVVVGWYALFLAFALALGHVRAALGPPYHEVIGINHVGFLGESLAQEYEQFSKAGIVFQNEPHEVGDTGLFKADLRDPTGFRYHIVDPEPVEMPWQKEGG